MDTVMPAQDQGAGTGPGTSGRAATAGASTLAGSRVGRPPSLQEMVAMKLSNKQEVQYPVHAFGRGGIGSFLSTGSARAGLARLPYTAHGNGAWGNPPPTTTARALSAGSAANTSRPGTCTSSLRSSMQGSLAATRCSMGRSAWGGSSRGADAEAVCAAKAWEQVVPHPHDFQAACRVTRLGDIPKASRWAAVSYYENDPAEVRRHIDITQQLDQLHAAGCAAEVHATAARQKTWAARQRAMFRRQRQEVAMRYEALGIQLSPTQAYVLSTTNETVIDGDAEDAAAGAESAAAAAVAAGAAGTPPAGFVRVSLPKPTFVKVFDRMTHEAHDTARILADAWRKGRAEEQQHKERAALASEVAELDVFDEVLASTQRLKTRTGH